MDNTEFQSMLKTKYCSLKQKNKKLNTVAWKKKTKYVAWIGKTLQMKNF